MVDRFRSTRWWLIVFAPPDAFYFPSNNQTWIQSRKLSRDVNMRDSNLSLNQALMSRRALWVRQRAHLVMQNLFPHVQPISIIHPLLPGPHYTLLTPQTPLHHPIHSGSQPLTFIMDSLRGSPDGNKIAASPRDSMAEAVDTNILLVQTVISNDCWWGG